MANISKKCLIIAEAGVNHNGRLKLALELCKAAKDANADVVKFQTWNTEKMITRSVPKANYQIKNTSIRESQFDMLKRLELSYNDFRKIKAYCDEINIIFASTADDKESLDFLLDLGVPFIKVGSGDIGNIPFLRYAGSRKKPVILSTGMSSLADVETSIGALCKGGSTDITLLHCTTDYPCPFDSVNLRAMETLRNAFKLPVGYSDHTRGIEIALAAVVLGAKIIEKHFTLSRTLAGPDQIASTEPDEFKAMVSAIRNIELAMGTGIKVPTLEEERISSVVKKRIVAKRQIGMGQIINESDICVKRNDSGIPAKYWDVVVGTVARRNYKRDEGIKF